MKTDNELIAEFMEEPLTFLHDTGHVVVERKLSYDNYYHQWSNLMPVVEKIEKIDGVIVIIKKSRCRILYSKKVFSCHTISKINSMYQVVVEFIKWYNERR